MKGLHTKTYRKVVPCCINPEHLFIGTQPENIADMENKGRGRHPAGPEHGRALLTAAQVREIRASPRIKGERLRLAEKFDVPVHVIQYARKIGTWSNVP